MPLRRHRGVHVLGELLAEGTRGGEVRPCRVALVGHALAQGVEAWEADEDFVNARMLGQVEIEQDAKGNARGEFSAWAQHRYRWKAAYAGQMARAGRVIALTTATAVVAPSAEKQVRPLTKLLKLPDADEVIPQVWEHAVDRASGDLSLTGGYIRRIIDEQQLLGKPSPEDKAVELDGKVRQFRRVFNELHRRMNHVDFDDRVIGWINEQMDAAG